MTAYQIDPAMCLRRPLPSERCDYVLLAFPIPWAIKRNTGMSGTFPAVFTRDHMVLAANAARGLLSPSGSEAQSVEPVFMDAERAKQLGINAFDVRNLFWKFGPGRNPGNHPIYQALIGMAVCRDASYRGTYSPAAIKALCRSLMLEWGSKRMDFEVDRLLVREDAKPCLLERDETGQYRFPIEKWREAKVVTPQELAQIRMARFAPSKKKDGEKAGGKVGRPKGTAVEAVLAAGGAMRTADIVAALEGKMYRESICVTLNRLKNLGRVEHVDRGVWALAVDKSASPDQ
jgi:hypothetical protein